MASSSRTRNESPVPEPPPRKRLSVRPVDILDLDAVHRVHFDRAIREVGKISNDSTAIFLPASAEECSTLINRWKHLPNTASPVFSLRRYTHPDEVNFKELVNQDTGRLRPDTFYPPQLTTPCTTFATGGVYLALFGDTSQRRRYTDDFWPLRPFPTSLTVCNITNSSGMVIKIALSLPRCLLSPSVNSVKSILQPRSTLPAFTMPRPRMSLKTRFFVELQDLAIPIPLDPSTREGQLLLSVTNQGSKVDHILHPVYRKRLFPDPTFAISPTPSSQSTHPATVTKQRLRPPSPDFDKPGMGSPSVVVPRNRKPPKRFPVAPDPIDVDAEDELDVFSGTEVPDVPVLRPSIARSAKAKPKIPEEFRKVPAPSPVTKRDRSPAETKLDVALSEPPPKKRRTHKTAGKVPADSLAPLPDEPLVPHDREPLRVQDGPPDYFYGDDSRTLVHQRFLTSSSFQPKTPFSQVIVKARDNNKKVSKLPFLRAPKWNLSEEMQGFGAFANIGDTTYSLQGLSRFGYASSRFFWPSNSQTLPSPESLHSTNNCLTCISRGEVCESSEKPGGICRQCNGTHRSCPSCLSLEEHRDRFLAIHNHIQGYPDGYAAALDHFASELKQMTKLEDLLQDSRRSLAKSMQNIRAVGFDINVVLSQWMDHNPNLVLDYDTVTWLATFFGWDSSCNLIEFLATPEDRERLEEFIRNNLTNPAAPSASLAVPTTASLPASTPRSPVVPVAADPPRSSRRRPAAGVPINFSQEPKLPSPVADEEMDIEDGASASRNSAGPALVTEYDDSDEEDDAEEDTDDDDPAPLAPSKSPTISDRTPTLSQTNSTLQFVLQLAVYSASPLGL
ncbi:hypothetical protein F5878DRAFT_667584 [Lentinula raphanica]|uniref:Uncharacterized protein n=1 Tax=Lentinula raphanica TaxID=153919 RepID=A0AA38NVI6_9AGAR|nr:hypothetical protein F5878DRAFT_667584 [Lentinula raphanica]